MAIYGWQLFFNFLWSIIFFNLQNILLAFFVLIILWILIVVMIKSFKEINPLAAWLQIPCLLWVTFAGYLNLMLYTLNQ
ncbi:TspO/MBR family protein [Cellulosilyticum sp. WCF-2]|uniref:TspO/MBR family protein n=1 Tax=Cellulosilyticum sp. WCF-2 TaxID=2497860 RepID=UPI000F8C37B6|nr:tryptophan-rich sensory protein [Cellulosilyticum sp. WCF-2]